MASNTPPRRRSPARTLFIGLDATDLHLAQQFAADGDMPVLTGLLRDAASIETVAPVGYFVGANWPTIFTGTTASRHNFTCAGQVQGGTYSPRWAGPISDPPAVWQRVSDAGGRVASIDAPHARVAEDLRGVQIVEWGCHDRHAGTRSYPPDLLADLESRHGAHPVGTRLHSEREHFAPCDFVHRDGDHRTADEHVALLETMRDGIRAKRALSLELLDQGGWDLFFTVFGEGHCTGHQFWHVHDATHPWHDPATRERLGVDPLRVIYGELDAAIGAHLDRLDDDAAAYVLLSHGMRAHYDGTQLLDPLLWRLDRFASGRRDLGWLSKSAELASTAVPRRARAAAYGAAATLRRSIASRRPFGHFDEQPPWLGLRRWWAQMNDTVCGSVRVNLEDREPNGRIAAGAYRDTLCWLAERLLEIVNVDTGEQAVADVLFTDDNYERRPGDPFGDLIVEWNRSAPIETVWSPAIGIVHVPYDSWRTGDHHRGGLLLARGHGIEPGRRADRMPVLDIAPTLGASLCFDFPDMDGHARDDLVGTHGGGARAVAPRPELVDARSAPASTPSRRRWTVRHDVPHDEWSDRFALGLGGAHHHTATVATELRDTVDRLQHRLDDLERSAAVATVGAWLRQAEVPEKLLISVVMPTRNRCELLPRAFESVRAQSYTRWELLIVDDGSDDGTPAYLDHVRREEPRAFVTRLDPAAGASVARNVALEAATGDVVVYLDDDNRFDPDWLRAVAWAFTEHPDSDVAYGARVVDDARRHHSLGTGGLPAMQFLAWDRATFERENLVDQNVIAHRRGFANARFDPDLTHYSDWDLLLQLTDRADPLELPVVATYFMTDAPGRLSDAWGAPHVVRQYDYVRAKTAARRSAR